MSDHDMATARWELEHCAIFGDDHVEARQVSRDLMKIRQSASGHQDDDDATSPGFADCLSYRRIEHTVHGDGAVVVECKGREFHLCGASVFS